MLEVRGLEKSFKRPIVQGVDFEVNPGEVVGLLGPNGAGKTTTFRMTMGMIRPDAGTVTFLGKEVSRWPLYKRARIGMGYLPQEHSEFRDLSVEENKFNDGGGEQQRDALKKSVPKLRPRLPPLVFGRDRRDRAATAR